MSVVIKMHHKIPNSLLTHLMQNFRDSRLSRWKNSKNFFSWLYLKKIATAQVTLLRNIFKKGNLDTRIGVIVEMLRQLCIPLILEN